MENEDTPSLKWPPPPNAPLSATNDSWPLVDAPVVQSTPQDFFAEAALGATPPAGAANNVCLASKLSLKALRRVQVQFPAEGRGNDEEHGSRNKAPSGMTGTGQLTDVESAQLHEVESTQLPDVESAQKGKSKVTNRHSLQRLQISTGKLSAKLSSHANQVFALVSDKGRRLKVKLKTIPQHFAWQTVVRPKLLATTDGVLTQVKQQTTDGYAPQSDVNTAPIVADDQTSTTEGGNCRRQSHGDQSCEMGKCSKRSAINSAFRRFVNAKRGDAGQNINAKAQTQSEMKESETPGQMVKTLCSVDPGKMQGDLPNPIVDLNAPSAEASVALEFCNSSQKSGSDSVKLNLIAPPKGAETASAADNETTVACFENALGDLGIAEASIKENTGHLRKGNGVRLGEATRLRYASLGKRMPRLLKSPRGFRLLRTLNTTAHEGTHQQDSIDEASLQSETIASCIQAPLATGGSVVTSTSTANYDLPCGATRLPNEEVLSTHHCDLSHLPSLEPIPSLVPSMTAMAEGNVSAALTAAKYMATGSAATVLNLIWNAVGQGATALIEAEKPTWLTNGRQDDMPTPKTEATFVDSRIAD